MTDSIQAVAAAYGVDPEQFAIAYTAFAARRLADAPTDQQRAQWADNLVEAAVAARDIIAPIPVPPPPTAEETPEVDDIEAFSRHQEGAYEDEDESGMSALQRLFEKQRNQAE